MELSKFQQLIKRCRKKDSGNIEYCVGIAYFLFQFHVTANTDDMMNFELDDLMANIEVPDTIKSKMRWSNCELEEYESPDQIIF